ncbi:uncharacterized protein IL334_002074 [Kwoniella shivajii]|uniref:Uncharacterized protein n=1 Tax=Kwoniella shivajii TaxID=564305 RepID=A0ABZ1CUU9_9TREE|nr:hypothetical protein IL334_002074 [Kwoniella shivajii]
MSSLAESPSSSLMSHRPTSMISRPGSPLSVHSRSTSPFPYATHTGKSKSISSLPPQSIHRFTSSTNSIIFPQAGPSNYNHSLTEVTSRSSSSSLSRSSSLKHRSKSPRKATSTLSRSSSVRSKATSPSRLPSTDSVSYFPPFEDMGSHEQPISQDGQNDARSNHQRAHRQEGKGHAKGRSLNSIAGIMSASLSWSLSSLACTSPPLPSSSDTDGKVLEELSSKFTPGKRRVLEPFSVATIDLSKEERSSSITKQKQHKRRMKSEIEVDIVLATSNSNRRVESIRGRKRVDEEDLVDNLLIETPSRPQLSTRRTRPNLRLPIPSLPNWRFPLGPSPPVTCLSPDIPLEAFSTAIDNPCLSTPSRMPSPLKSPNTFGIEEDVEAVDVGLSPSPSPTSPCSFENQLSTPPKGDHNLNIHVEGLSPSWREKVESDLGLRRIGSRTSEMSCETIKQDWLDVTPKPNKIVKRAVL